MEMLIQAVNQQAELFEIFPGNPKVERPAISEPYPPSLPSSSSSNNNNNNNNHNNSTSNNGRSSSNVITKRSPPVPTANNTPNAKEEEDGEEESNQRGDVYQPLFIAALSIVVLFLLDYFVL